MTSDAPQSKPPDIFGELIGPEAFWRDHYDWLKERGYQLRPRFTPGWTPSWKRTGKSPLKSEDGIFLRHSQINDAIHLPTGRHVAMKLVYKEYSPFEVNFMRYFSSELIIADKRSHFIPVLEILRPLGESDDSIQLVVMPFVRPAHSPPFDTVGEVVQYVRALLEAVQLMHENKFAHRDLNLNNFMMETDKMYPHGHHPTKYNKKPDMSGRASYYTRTQRPSKYFVIDFGISKQYTVEDTAPLEPITIGGDRTVPEFQNTEEPQNPFQTDIYYAGNLIRQQFIQGHPALTQFKGYTGTDFLRPLVSDMTQNDPTKRPTIDEALARFEEIVSSLSTWELRARVSSKRFNVFQYFEHFLGHWGRKCVYVIKKTPPIPQP